MEEELIREAALALRRLWMTQYGLDEKEIEESLDGLDLEDEWEQLMVVKALRKRNEEKGD